MINNIKSFALHLAMTLISFIILIMFISTGPRLGIYTTHIISRVALSGVLIGSYIFIGTLLNVENNPKHDIFAGTIIATFGITLWIYTFRLTGRNLLEVPEELRVYWIGFNSYYMTFAMTSFLLGIHHLPIVALLDIIYPSILIWCGMRLKRKRREKI